MPPKKPVAPPKHPIPQQVTRISYRNAREVIQTLYKPKAKGKKYKNVPVDDPEHGHFDSQVEHARWHELLQMQRAGAIRNLERQVTFSIDINGVHICKYKADFVYETPVDHAQWGKKELQRSWSRVIEDKKGYETKDFKLKAKLMEATGRPLLIT